MSLKNAINRLAAAMERRNEIEERWIVESKRNEDAVRYRCLPAWVRNIDEGCTRRAANRIDVTARQLEYCVWVARGFGDRQVASHMGVSVYTVKETMRQLYRRFRVPNRRELIASLMVQGTLTTDMIAGVGDE